MLNPDSINAIRVPQSLRFSTVERPLAHHRVAVFARRCLLEPLSGAIFDTPEECMRFWSTCALLGLPLIGPLPRRPPHIPPHEASKEKEMKHKQHLSAAVAALLAALALTASVGQAAPGPAEFVDPAGDSGPGPDITKVSVSADNAGLISLRIEIPNRPTLAPNQFVTVNVDTDENSSTGDE